MKNIFFYNFLNLPPAPVDNMHFVSEWISELTCESWGPDSGLHCHYTVGGTSVWILNLPLVLEFACSPFVFYEFPPQAENHLKPKHQDLIYSTKLSVFFSKMFVYCYNFKTLAHLEEFLYLRFFFPPMSIWRFAPHGTRCQRGCGGYFGVEVSLISCCSRCHSRAEFIFGEKGGVVMRSKREITTNTWRKNQIKAFEEYNWIYVEIGKVLNVFLVILAFGEKSGKFTAATKLSQL